MKVSKRLLYGAAIALALASIALIIRLILYPDISLVVQLGLYLISIFIIGLYLSGFYVINDFLNHKLPYGKSVTLRIICQILAGFVYVLTLRTAIFYFLADFAPFDISKFFATTAYLMDLFISLAINTGFFAAYFFSEWKQSLLKAQRLEKEKMQVQYDSLKNQLNPHFLFNTLSSLNSLIFEDQELASQYLRHLSKLYRYLLENREVVSLEKEICFLENYLFILKTRYGKALEFCLDIKEEERLCLLVPATLQNLIENAVKHNVVQKEHPLQIKIFSEEGFLYVQNNVQKKKIVENSNKQGLENMKLLYRYLSDKELTIEETGDHFLVKIPLIK